MIALIISLCSGALVYAVSVMYAGIGETFSERAGIMNLGVEGVMLMGAVSGYITAVKTQNLALSFLVVLLTGAILGLVFAFLTVTLQSDQTVCGMAMLIFGTGLSGFIGKDAHLCDVFYCSIICILYLQNKIWIKASCPGRKSGST